MTEPTLSPSEILMELILPSVLEARSDAFRAFPGRVEVRIHEDGGERTWWVQARDNPWVRRGPCPDSDVQIRLDAVLVLEALRGASLDLDAEVEAGRLRLSGDPELMDRLGRVLEGAGDTLASVRAKRG